MFLFKLKRAAYVIIGCVQFTRLLNIAWSSAEYFARNERLFLTEAYLSPLRIRMIFGQNIVKLLINC